MQKYTFLARSWHVSDVAFKFSPLRLVSGFSLSGRLFFAMQFIYEFIWVSVRWNGLIQFQKIVIFMINKYLLTFIFFGIPLIYHRISLSLVPVPIFEGAVFLEFKIQYF